MSQFPDRFDVCLINVIPIARDPRVRKQAESLMAGGLQVIGLCEDGENLAPVDWPTVVAQPQNPLSVRNVGGMALKGDIRALFGVCIRSMQPFSRVSNALAERLLMASPRFSRLLQVGQGIAADVYVANDWPTLPIAAALAQRHGGVVVYDSHEYAAEELIGSRRWRVFNRPLVRAIETRYIQESAIVSTVSQEIALQLQQDHRLATAPIVIRNVPSTQPLKPASRPAARGLTVLYHGSIVAQRRLDILVASVANWREGARLIVRGDGPQETIDGLRTLAAKLALGERIHIEPGVPQADIVSCASSADLGFVCLPPNSRQNHFAMPNKAFEYIHAGLGLIVPPLATMGAFVRANGIGVVLSEFLPIAIADAVNAIGIDDVERFRAASGRIASDLVWQQEAKPWIERIAKLANHQRASVRRRS
jgi:glycogen synthase